MSKTFLALATLGCVVCALSGIEVGATPDSLSAPLSKSALRLSASTPALPRAVVLVQGTIKALAKPPKPGSVPYKDAVIAIHLVDVKALTGKADQEVLVFAWGMRANKWTSAAAYKVGQTVTLALQPWDDVVEQYGGYNRIELDDDHLFDLEAYWGEVPQPTTPAKT